MSEREEFEAWCRSEDNGHRLLLIEKYPDNYRDDEIDDMWIAWQASRQAISAELEALRKLAAVVAREDWRSRSVNVALDALKLASNGGA